jgi:hypothetical protein
MTDEFDDVDYDEDIGVTESGDIDLTKQLHMDESKFDELYNQPETLIDKPNQTSRYGIVPRVGYA